MNFYEDEVFSIENERQLSMCDGCLSSDRLLAPVGKLRDLFYRIMSHDDKDGILSVSNLWQSEPHLCWECRKVLLNAHRLQQRVYEAQKSLHLAMPAEGCAIISIQCDSLSTLTGCFKESFDYNIVFDGDDEILIKSEENNMQLDNSASNMPEADFDNAENDDTYVENDEAYLENDDDDVVLDSDDVVMIPDDESPKKAKTRKKRRPKKKKVLTKYINAALDTSVYTVIPIDKEEFHRQIIKKKFYTKFVSAEFTCDKCARVFITKPALDKHNKKLHDPNKTFVCDVCPGKCSSEKILRRHKKTHVYYKCNFCEYKSGQLNKFGNHFMSKHARSFKCCDCGMEFTNKSELGEHARCVHKGYECDHCGRVMRQKSALAIHMIQYHNQVKCKLCAVTCANATAERKHFKLKHEKRSKDPIYCVECNVTFETGAQFQHHVNYHHGNSYECKKCKKIFKTRNQLREHNNYHHKKKTDFCCKKCDKFFTRKESMNRHMLRTHSNNKPDLPKTHICEHCSRAISARNLAAHIRTHTGVRPYACAQCPSRFTQRTPLVYHLRKVHREEGITRDILRKNKEARDSATDSDSSSDDCSYTSSD